MAPEQLGKAQRGAYVMWPFGTLPRLYWSRTSGKFARKLPGTSNSMSCAQVTSQHPSTRVCHRLVLEAVNEEEASRSIM